MNRLAPSHISPSQPTATSTARGLVLHGAWLNVGGGRLAIWAEAEVKPVKRRASQTDPAEPASGYRSHPFCARREELLDALERLWRTARPGVAPRTSAPVERIALWLPRFGVRPVPSPTYVARGWAPQPEGIDGAVMSVWRVNALLLQPESACTLLAGLPIETGAEAAAAALQISPFTTQRRLDTSPMPLGDDLRFWAAAARFLMRLALRQRYVPSVSATHVDEFGYPRSMLVGEWRLAPLDEGDQLRYDTLVAAMPDAARAAAERPRLSHGWGTPRDYWDIDESRNTAAIYLAPARPAEALDAFTSASLNALIAAWARTSQSYLSMRPGGHVLPNYYYSYGSPYTDGTMTSRWFDALNSRSTQIYLKSMDSRKLAEGVERWLRRLEPGEQAPFRLCLRLTTPDERASDERAVWDGADADPASAGDAAGDVATKADESTGEPSLLPLAADGRAASAAGASLVGMEGAAWRLDYLLQARDDPSLLLPLSEAWDERGAVARYLDRRFARPWEHALTWLGQAAQVFPPIADSLADARPAGCDLTGVDAYAFLTQAIPALEELGIATLAPAWWKRAPIKPTLRLEVRGPHQQSSGLLGLDAVLTFDWKIALGGAELSAEEMEQLAALKEPLVRLRGTWVELRPDDVAAALRAVATRHARQMSLGEAVRMTMTGRTDADGLVIEQVRADEWIGDLLGRMRSGETITEIALPAGLRAELRPYQKRGVDWLTYLAHFGLGACLADDMGLGKCCLPGTIVSTLGGPLAIETLWNQVAKATTPDSDNGEWGQLQQPLDVHTFDGRDITSALISRVYRQHIEETCVDVRLSDGAHLKTTQRHRYLTPGGWKLAGELAVGDLVAVPSHTPHRAGNELSPELAELMAWQLAEGFEHVAYHAGGFCNSDVEVLARFHELALMNGIRLPMSRPARTTHMVTTGKLFYLFEPWGYQWGLKSATKIIPQSIFDASPEAQKAFISAMMDAEGHVGRTHCEFVSASPSIAYGMKDLLRNFGVWMRIRVAMKAATNGARIARPYFVCTFGGNSVQRFAAQFRLRIGYKQAALETLAAFSHNSNVEGIPTQVVVAAMKKRGIALRSVGLRSVYGWQGMGAPLAHTVSERLRQKAHEDLAQQIEDLAAPGVHWCRVKCIEQFEYSGYVYDLEVPETHNYIANGIVTHNTVQFLALLAHLKESGAISGPALLICPTSVVGNWMHETNRFTPELRALVHHGAGRVGRSNAEGFVSEAANNDLVITTYSLLPRDLKALGAVNWSVIALDEAQYIKNAETKQSHAARALSAPVRVALTGTPVENRLAELWSIMQFLNPGYLGSQRRFHEQFAMPIEQRRDQRATAQLHALTRPFILRRLKTDPQIISDLPEKVEMREYCTLTREQATLYEAVVRDGLRQMEQSDDPMGRRGVILAMLTRLKQVCNHPAHFLNDGSALPGRSGKLARLDDLVTELLDDGDRALIFTQFTVMGERLVGYLTERFGRETLFLHGGVARQQRERMVERFQSGDGPPLFVLSLRAGGTGLNLTNANHVIHFDRWWNPAVETQATDRAFRIGQARNVQVRKFVCSGTLEERIDEMIERKRTLTENVFGSGEGWLTELSTDELRDIFRLRADAVAN